MDCECSGAYSWYFTAAGGIPPGENPYSCIPHPGEFPRETPCNYSILHSQVLRTTGEELDGDKVVHLSDPLKNFIHHQRLAEEFSRIVTSVDEMKGELNKRETDITGRIDNLEKQLEKRLVNLHVPRDQQSVDNGLVLRLKQLEAQDAHSQSLIKALRKESHDLRAEMQALRREIQQLQRTGQPFARHTNRDTQG